MGSFRASSPQTSFLVGTFFAVSYSKPALVQKKSHSNFWTKFFNSDHSKPRQPQNVEPRQAQMCDVNAFLTLHYSRNGQISSVNYGKFSASQPVEYYSIL